MFDKFLELIAWYIKINDSDIDFLRSHMPLIEYKKNDLIFTERNISDTIYFVLEGCVRLYYNVDGNEKTAFFYPEGKFICAGESYTFNIPAKENFQAVENTTLMHFSKKNIEKLLDRSPKFEVMARIAVEDELITCQQIIASFVTKSPEERYLDLLQTNGDLFHRVPQQYIASYLGISPESLSRIKKRVLKKSK